MKPSGRLGELAKIRAENRAPVTKVLPMIKEVALKESGPDPDRDPMVIHPSEMAKADWCVRATFYRMSGKPEPDRKFNFVLENIFAEGNGIHAKFQSWLRGTGKLFGLWVCLSCGMEWTGISAELPTSYPGCVSCMCDLDYSNPPCGHEDERLHVWDYREVRLRVPGCAIVGRADGALEDTMVECKSVGVGTLRIEAGTLLKRYYNDEAKLYDLDRLWKELRRPFPGHIRQANIYLWLAREMGLPYTRMTFIYEFKPNQQVREYSITLSDDIMKPLLEKADKVVNALQYNRPPACEFGGCEQCRAYEGGESSEGSKAAADPGEQSDRPARRVVTRRTAGNGEARARGSAPETRRRATRAARGTDRAARPRADEAVQPAQPVERASGLSTERGAGRRTVRRAARGEADRAGADPQ